MKISFLIRSTLQCFLWTASWRYVFLLLFLSGNFFVQAQTKIWDKTLGGDKADDLTTMIATPDGGYLVGGSSQSNKSGDKSEESKNEENLDEYNKVDYWIVKLDANGKKLWDKTIGGNNRDNLTTMVTTLDGGYLLGGSSYSGKGGDKSEEKRGGSDYWVVKIDANGQKVWDKTYGDSSNDNLTVIIATNNGGYLLGGSSLINIDEQGDIIWDKDLNYNIQDMITTPDGGYMLGRNLSKADYSIVKLDGKGNALWGKTFGGSGSDYLNSLLLASDGGYLLGGYSTSGKSGDKSKSYSGYWIVKVTASGQKVWDKTYGGSYKDEFRDMIATADGGYLLGGTSTRGIGGDKSEAKFGYWIVKIKENGTKVWDRTFGGSINFFNLKAMVATPDKGFLVGGISYADIFDDKSEPSRGSADYWVVKVKDNVKKVQTITLAAPLQTKELDDAPFTLSAQASSGLPVTFNLVSGPATIRNNVLTLTGVGKVTVKASQPGNATYDAAPEVIQTILVDTPTPVTKLWDKTIGGIYNDALTTIIPTPDGGYLLGGVSRKSLQAEPGFSITKIASNGQKEWDKDLGGDNETRLTIGVVATDGGYLFGGSSGMASLSEEYYKFYLVKTSQDGTKEWQNMFSGPGFLSALVATPDGGYLLGGTTYEYKGEDKTETSRGKNDYWVVKIDAAGNKLWDKTLGGKENEELTSLIATADGGYLVGGSSNSGKSGDKSEANKGMPDENGYLTPDYWIIKIDAKGKKVWDKTFGGDKSDGVSTLLATSDGGFLLGGTSYSGKSGDKSGEQRTIDNLRSSDYWLIKIDAQGQKVWDKTLGGENYESFTALVTTPEGGYLLGGTSYSGAAGDKSEPSRDKNPSQKGDFWVVKIKEDISLMAEWNMRYGGSRDEGFTSIIKTSDGGYLSGGYSASVESGDKTQASQGNNDYWIVKSDQNGKKLWDKRYGGSGEDYLNRVIQTSDGGYLLVGSSLSEISGDKTQMSQGDRDYWIVKIDKRGKKQWDKSYGGRGYDELKKVLQLSTGEYLLAGFSNSPVSGDKSQASHGGNDFWLVKISSTGTKIWDKSYGGSLEETLGGIVSTEEGGFLLGGSSWSGKSGNKSEESRGKSDFWLVAVDKEGKQLWDQTYGGTGTDEAYSLGKAGNTYFLAGQSDSPAGLDKTRDSQGGLDYWLLKVTSTGKKVWDKRYGGSKDDELRASIPTQDGGYLLAGKSFSSKSGNKRQDSQGSSDYWMVKTDKEGQYEWSKTFGGSGAEELRAVIQTNEGGFLLGGKSDSGVSGDRTQPSQGGTDYWLVKVTPEAKSIVAEREAMVIAEPETKVELVTLTVYPNPAQEKVTVSFTLPQTQAATIKVYDSQGRETATLFQGEAKANQMYQVKWQARNQAAGMYLLRLHTEGKYHMIKLLLTR